MADTSHWDMQLLRGKTYAERAEECRVLAEVCPEHLRQSYLELAAAYEQLAKVGLTACWGFFLCRRPNG